MKNITKIVYISGPITGTDDYRERFRDVEKRLLDNGYRVFNPVVIPEFIDKISGYQFEYEDYIDFDLLLVDKADIVYMMKGWEDSPGANKERDLAIRKGKLIMYESEDTSVQ